MKSEHRRGAGAIACALLCTAVLGQPLPGASVWLDRERLLAYFEGVAEVDLKALYLLCARVSALRLLDFEEAARCSIAAEVLKKRSFAGDFDALIAWWRLHRDDLLDESLAVGAVRRPLPGR